MTKSYKIINILSAPPLFKSIEGMSLSEIIQRHVFEYLEIDENVKYAFFFFEDFHVLNASRTINLTREFELECWRPYGSAINKIYSKRFNGILHRLFPSSSHYLPVYGSWSSSSKMLLELKKEIRNYNILVHFQDGHTKLFTNFIHQLKKYNVPIIVSHQSGSFPIFHIDKISKFKPFHKLFKLYHHKNQVSAYKKLDCYFAASFTEYDYMLKKLRMKNVYFQRDGINFDKFYPTKDKRALRVELNLPIESKLILYVGKFYRTKSVDWLIKNYFEYRTKFPNTDLVLIGGDEDDEFYSMAVKSGAIVRTRMPKENIVKYMQACDIYTLPTHGAVVHSGGFGNAPIEALACNIPVISNHLIHFPGIKTELDSIGKTMWNEEEFVSNLEFMIKNLSQYNNCREVARNYFDEELLQKFVIDKYKQLFNKYYKKEL
ncbi:MAG: glycosyltransferase [Melioribacteraceae bacterium]|nr:glycosyltransferase [Melioribacteraceae bacterium]